MDTQDQAEMRMVRTGVLNAPSSRKPGLLWPQDARAAAVADLANAQELDIFVRVEDGLPQRRELDRRARWANHFGGANSAWGRNTVGTSVSWRTDRFRKIRGGHLRVPYRPALNGFLYLPWVLLEDIETGERLGVIGVHHPMRPADPDGNTRAACYRRWEAKTRHWDRRSVRWVVAGDLNDGAPDTTGSGRVAARTGVDFVIASDSLRRRGPGRLIAEGVAGRLTDHHGLLLVDLRGAR